MSSRAQLLWLVLAFILFIAIGLILRLVRHRNLRSKYGLLWVAVGIALVPLALFPGFVDWAARSVGVLYQPTVIMLAAIGLLLLLAMHYSWELSRLEERSRTLAEEVALLRAEMDVLRNGQRPGRTPPNGADNSDTAQPG